MNLTSLFSRRRETSTKVLEGADEVGDVLSHGLTVLLSLRGHLVKLGKLLSLMNVLEPLSLPKVRLGRPPIALGLPTLLVEVVHLLLLRPTIVPSWTCFTNMRTPLLFGRKYQLETPLVDPVGLGGGSSYCGSGGLLLRPPRPLHVEAVAAAVVPHFLEHTNALHPPYIHQWWRRWNQLPVRSWGRATACSAS